MADDATQALQDIAGQIGGFESGITEQLGRVEHKVDAITQALAVPPVPTDAPEIRVNVTAQAPAFAEVAELPPAVSADAPQDKGAGILSSMAHTVAGLKESAVEAVRSWEERAREKQEDYPDMATAPVNAATHTPAVMASGAPVVDVKAGDLPPGPHTQAVAQRRTQPAPAMAGMEF